MSEEKQRQTKKNEDFIFHFKKLLAQNGQLSPEKIESVTNEVTEKLLEAQRTGITAAQLYGTPTQAVAQFLDPKQTARKLHEYKFWELALDTSMAILMLFAGVFGLSLFFSKQAGGQGAGIVSLLLIAFLGGSLYTAVVLKLTPNPKAQTAEPRSRRWLYLGLALVAWVVGFIVLGLLPPVINPTLPPVAYIVVAAVAYGVFRWNRQQAGLKGGGFLAISLLSQQARLEAAQTKK